MKLKATNLIVVDNTKSQNPILNKNDGKKCTFSLRWKLSFEIQTYTLVKSQP